LYLPSALGKGRARKDDKNSSFRRSFTANGLKVDPNPLRRKIAHAVMGFMGSL